MNSVRRSAHRPVWSTLALAIVFLASCGVSGTASPSRINVDRLPAELVTPSTAAATTIAPPDTMPPSDASTSTTVPMSSSPLWLVQKNRLVASTRSYVGRASAAQVLAALAKGPSEREVSESSLRSAITPDSFIDVKVTAGVAVVDLSPTFDEIPVADQILALGQTVLSLTELPGVGQVSFLLGEEPIPAPLADGTSASGPVSRDGYLALTSA
ncbi:MAG: GerMN domain-containing protein [Acidimicrobiia bacterium]